MIVKDKGFSFLYTLRFLTKHSTAILTTFPQLERALMNQSITKTFTQTR